MVRVTLVPPVSATVNRRYVTDPMVRSLDRAATSRPRRCGAAVLTVIPAKSTVWPDVSTRPPSPPSGRPRGMRPWTAVAPVDQRATSPPLPSPVRRREPTGAVDGHAAACDSVRTFMEIAADRTEPPPVLRRR